MDIHVAEITGTAVIRNKLLNRIASSRMKKETAAVINPNVPTNPFRMKKAAAAGMVTTRADTADLS